MNDVWDFLREGTVPITPGDTNGAWASYIEAFLASRKWPRYYLASLDMSFGGWHYKWGVVPGTTCMVIVKWITMGGLKIHLMMPPLVIVGGRGRRTGSLGMVSPSRCRVPVVRRRLAILRGANGSSGVRPKWAGIHL